MATRTEKKERRNKVSAKRRLSEHKIGGGSNHITLPDGCELFTPKPGSYRLEFLPYVVKNNPYAKEGELHFERTYYIHRNVGPNNEWCICLAKTYGKPCPICEYRSKLTKDPSSDEETVKALAPAERQLFILVEGSAYDQKLIWDVSHHLFGKQLDNKIQNSDEEDGYDLFADVEEGKTVRVSFKQSDQGKWLETIDIEFKDRRKPLPSSVFEDVPCLDDMLKPMSYEKMKSLLLQIEEDNDDGDDKSVKKSAKKPTKKNKTADDCGLSVGDTVTYSEGDPDELYTIDRISGDGTSLILEDSDGNKIKAVAVEEVDLVEEDEKPTKAKKTVKKIIKSKKNDDDDDDSDFNDDDDDDDDDDEPEEKSVKKTSKKPVKKTTKSKKNDDDDDDDFDDWDE